MERDDSFDRRSRDRKKGGRKDGNTKEVNTKHEATEAISRGGKGGHGAGEASQQPSRKCQEDTLHRNQEGDCESELDNDKKPIKNNEKVSARKIILNTETTACHSSGCDEIEPSEQTVVDTPSSSDSRRRRKVASIPSNDFAIESQVISGKHYCRDEYDQSVASRMSPAKPATETHGGQSTRSQKRHSPRVQTLLPNRATTREPTSAPTSEELRGLNLERHSSSRRGSTNFFWKRDFEHGEAEERDVDENNHGDVDHEEDESKTIRHNAPQPLSARKLIGTGRVYADGNRRRFLRFVDPGAVQMSGRALNSGVNAARRLSQLPETSEEFANRNEIAPQVDCRQSPEQSGDRGLSAFVVAEGDIADNDNDDDGVVIEGVDVKKIVPNPATCWDRKLALFAAIACSFILGVFTVSFLLFFTAKTSTASSTYSPTVSPEATALSSHPSTFAPTTDRSVRIRVHLTSVSSSADLRKEGTPQRRAMEWLIHDDVLQREADDPRLLQRYILAIIFFATNGKHWQCRDRGEPTPDTPCFPDEPPMTFLTEWDECEWNGVTCEPDTAMVRALIMPGQGVRGYLIGGTLPSEIGELPMLDMLALPHNNITGTIPPEIISKTKRLTHLYLASNKLRGPFPDEAFRHHPNLRVINVPFNSFGGSVPASIATIEKLSISDFRSCQMSGTIPTVFGELVHLTELDLSDNVLTGSLPTELAQLLAMKSLQLSGNRLNGTIPADFYGAWPAMERLALDHNALSGTILDYPGSINWGISHDARKSILLSNNRFNGTVPPSLASVEPLNTLTLHGNRFEGTMPRGICSKTIDGGRGPRLFFALQNLTADCKSQLSCDCCSSCY